MSDERRAPVQGEYGRPAERVPNGSVAWWEHEEAYTAYAAMYGRMQSAERLAERAGFGYREITALLGHEPTTWQPGYVRHTPAPSTQEADHA